MHILVYLLRYLAPSLPVSPWSCSTISSKKRSNKHCFISKNSPKYEPFPLSLNKLYINVAEFQSLRFYINDECNTYSLTPGNTFAKKLIFVVAWSEVHIWFNNIPNSS